MEATAEVREPAVTIRPATPADRGFVLATWLKGHRHGSAWASRLTNETYFAGHHDLISGILGAATTRVLVACLDDAPDVLLGYVVTEPNVVHWAFTKREFRRFGVFSRLIEAAALPSDLADVEYTHDSFAFRRDIEARFPRAIFNPYRAFRPRGP